MLSIKTPRLNMNKTPYKRKVREDGYVGIGRAPGIDLIGTYSQHGSQKTLGSKLKKNKTKQSEFSKNYSVISTKPNIEPIPIYPESPKARKRTPPAEMPLIY